VSILIKAYYHEHKAVFNEKYNEVLEGFNADAIHKMRTSTKRLRALFQLLRVLSENEFNSKKQLKKVRTLFKFVGIIREIQIEQMLVWTYEEKLGLQFTEYMEYLLQREYREVALFHKHLPALRDRDELLKDHKIEKTIENFKVEKLVPLAEKYLQAKVEALTEIIAQPPDNGRIHTVRTLLKQIYYLHDILAGILGKEKLLSIDRERLREIEQYFGTWHDLVNSPTYMNAWFKTKKADKSEKYRTLKKQVQMDTKLMRMEIIGNLYPEIIDT
jgi:CHAD domain-containing protein